MVVTFLFFVFFGFDISIGRILYILGPMVNLIIFYVQQSWIWYTIAQFLMLHCLKVHLKSFQMDKQKLRSFLNHHLSCGNLFAIAIFTVKFISKIQQFFCAKFLEASTQRSIFFDIYRQIHKCFFPCTRPLTSLTFRYRYQLPFKHLLHPCLKLGHYFILYDLINFFLAHLSILRHLNFIGLLHLFKQIF